MDDGIRLDRRESMMAIQVEVYPDNKGTIPDVTVSKYKDDPFVGDEAHINWCAIGRCSVERAELFVKELKVAIKEAKKLNK